MRAILDSIQISASKMFFLILAMAVVCTCSDKNPTQNETTEIDRQWQMIWSDEFDSLPYIDTTRWSFDVGGHGWGNQELQYYTENRLENARIQDGKLIIQARKEEYQTSHYTSARMVTRHKGDWSYGRFEISAKLPSGKGTWPAIWMLPTDWTYGNGGWPDNGEIDIMEHVGYDPGNIHATIHCNKYNHRDNTQIGNQILVPDYSQSFHEYSLEWSPDTIRIYVDDRMYFSTINTHQGWQYWPFDKDFHLILNIAVGGSWGGAQGVDDAIFPQRMEIDYVRVYQKK